MSSPTHSCILAVLLTLGLSAGFAWSQSAEPTAPAAGPPVEARGDQVIVKYKAGAAQSRAANVNWRQRTKVERKLSRRLGIDLLELPRGKNLHQALAELNADPDVEYAEPNFVIKLTETPDDPHYAAGSLWGLDNSGQSIQNKPGVADADIDAPEAWNLRTSAEGIVVAVVDTGINFNHEDLKDNMWVNEGEIPNNEIDDDGNGYVDDIHGINALEDPATKFAGRCKDDNGHGTHVAGTIGGKGNNGKGVTGVAWDVQLMAVKFLNRGGSGTTADAIESIEYARQMGADIINASWGGGGYSQALYEAIAACRDEGIIFVAAAGNSSSNNDVSLYYPANYNLSNVVTVAASTNDEKKASFSSFGKREVDLFAPGEYIYSAYDDNNTAYRWLNGTSMATPHVAGAFALMKAHFPGETYSQLINRVLRTVDGSTQYQNRCNSGGRLNLHQALMSADGSPRNDHFADAVVMGNIGGYYTSGDTTAATLENSEPNHAVAATGQSVWFSWNAPEDGTAYISTAGSNFDTVVAVYTGNKLDNLVPVAANDNDPEGGTASYLEFEALRGKRYYIALDGAGGASGGFVLNVVQPPANDDFDNATPVSEGEITITSHNYGATAEGGEPAHAGYDAYASVWYKWTAPAAGTYVLDTQGSAIDTALAVYRGDTVADLALISDSDDIKLGTLLTSRVVITAAQGEVFHFAIDTVSGAEGRVRFNLAPGDGAWAAVDIGTFRNNANSSDYDATAKSMTLVSKGGRITPYTGFGTGYDMAYGMARTLEGDGEVVARVTGMTHTISGGEAGIMMRQSLDYESPHCALTIVDTADGLRRHVLWRTDFAEDAKANVNPIAQEMPIWLRLVRVGNLVTRYSSTDGADWRKVGTEVAIDDGQAVTVYLVAVGNGGNEVTALLDNISVVSYGDPGDGDPGDGDPGDPPSGSVTPVTAGIRFLHRSIDLVSELPIPIAVGPEAPVDGLTIEPRQIPNRSATFSVTFDRPVQFARVTVVDGVGELNGTIEYNGNEVLIPMFRLWGRKTSTIQIHDVLAADGTTLPVATFQVGFLRGDVNNDSTTTQEDVDLVMAAEGQPIDANNAIYDFDGNGILDNKDTTKVGYYLGKELP